MAKLESTKLVAHRFATLIRALGEIPLPHDDRSEKDYAVSLQQQYEHLKHSVNPVIAARARISTRAEIRRRTFEATASGPISSSPSKPRFLPKRHNSRRKVEAFFQKWGHLVPKCARCRMRCGLPKKSWPTLEMAEEALRRNPKATALHIYRCPHQPKYWHVGHRPASTQR